MDDSDLSWEEAKDCNGELQMDPEANGYSQYCTICSKLFSSATELERHECCKKKKGQLFSLSKESIKTTGEFIKRQLAGKSYPCSVCGKKLKTLKGLKVHKKIHNTPNTGNYVCIVCGGSFVSTFYLARHMRVHMDGLPYACSCGKRFAAVNLLKEHFKTHTDYTDCTTTADCTYTMNNTHTDSAGVADSSSDSDSSSAEDTCSGSDSTSEDNIGTSDTGTHVIKPYQCGECHMVFDVRSSLRTHLKKHRGEKLEISKTPGLSLIMQNLISHGNGDQVVDGFPCGHCEKCFPSLSELENHLQTHSEQEAVRCIFCHKSFPNSSRLQHHMQSHSQEDLILTAAVRKYII